MHFELTVTPVRADGSVLARKTYLLSQDDVEHPHFGELLRALILDWVEMTRWVDGYAREINHMSDSSTREHVFAQRDTVT
jgi:hypothetical protein